MLGNQFSHSAHFKIPIGVLDARKLAHLFELFDKITQVLVAPGKVLFGHLSS
jgi:hypothetical protein